MSNIFSLAFVVLLFAFPTFAQSGNSDRCEVITTDLLSKKTTKLGEVTTVIAEEETTTKAFTLPQSNLFIIASVFYTDESMTSEVGHDSISLTLALSKVKQPKSLNNLSNLAEAEMPLNSFDVGRITLRVKIKSRVQFVKMECRKDVRVK